MLHRPPPPKPQPEPPEARRRRLKAARDARHRQRERAGLMTVVVEVDAAGLDWLVKVRAIAAGDIDGRDPAHVRDAVGKGISEMIRISSRS